MTSYIEKDFPIGFLSRLAEQESWRKEVYRPVYYIHKWWAKRLGSVFRGIVLAACAEENSNIQEIFYKPINFSDITIFDPFMGSGVAVGEAVKLGCKAIGRDINPVSATIVKASLSQYNPDEVENIFSNIERKVKKRIKSYFKSKLQNGSIVDVLYYFWVKIIDCPVCEKQIELFKSRIFSKNAVPKKDKSARSICPQCSSINHTVYNSTSTTCQTCELNYNPQKGNITNGKVICPNCSNQFKLVDYLKDIKDPLEHKLYAKLVLLLDGSKQYEPVCNYDLDLYRKAKLELESIKQSLPFVQIKKGYNTNQVLKYNYNYWHQMFSARQLLCINILADEIKKISNFDLKRLFACLLSGVLEFNNMFCSFKGEGTGAVRHMFSHHILKPEPMPIEANIWGTPKSSGSFTTLYNSRIRRALAYKLNPFELELFGRKTSKVSYINKTLNCNIAESFPAFKANGASVYISQGDSAKTDIENNSIDIVVTDPPFFDNVHYSELADFFFYWLNQLLDISKKNTTRNIAEVQDTDAGKFSGKLSGVFLECSRVLKKDGLLIFTYHHSRHEGWVSVYNAIRKAGFLCIQSFPIKAEMSVSMPIQQAKTPIHLDIIFVCKKENDVKHMRANKDIVHTSAEAAKSQIADLIKSGIQISARDSMVAFMGRLLCELSRIGNTKKELDLLSNIEKESNEFISELLITKAAPDNEYELLKEPVQLTLFETMEKYLDKKMLKADKVSDKPNLASCHNR